MVLFCFAASATLQAKQIPGQDEFLRFLLLEHMKRAEVEITEKLNLHAGINICLLHALHLRGLRTESACIPRDAGKQDLMASLITD